MNQVSKNYGPNGSVRWTRHSLDRGGGGVLQGPTSVLLRRCRSQLAPDNQKLPAPSHYVPEHTASRAGEGGGEACVQLMLRLCSSYCPWLGWQRGLCQCRCLG